MKENRSQLDLWARRLEGDALSSAEEKELADALNSSFELAEAVSKDRNINELLRDHYRIVKSSEDFVARCSAQPAETNRSNSQMLSGSAPFEIVTVKSRVKTRRSSSISSWGTPIVSAAVLLVAFAGTRWFLNRQDVERGRKVIAENRSAPESFDQIPIPANKSVRNESPVFSEKLPDQQLIAEVPTQTENSLPDASASEQDASGLLSREIASAESTLDMPLEPLGQLINGDGSVWRVKPEAFTEYPVEFQLKEGFDELKINDGPDLMIRGPATVRLLAADRFEVDEGELQVITDEAKPELAIQTPTVFLIGIEPVESFLSVRPQQGTSVQVHKGTLEALPWNDESHEALVLSASGLDRGAFSAPWQAKSKEPAIAMAANGNGDLQSVVNVANKPLKITSPTILAQVLQTSQQELENRPDEFADNWQKMVEQMNSMSSNQLDSQMKIGKNSAQGRKKGGGKTAIAGSGGGSFSTGGQAAVNAEEVQRKMQEMREKIRASGKFFPGSGNSATANSSAKNSNGNSSSNFSGTMNINGVEKTFDSPEEFAKAQEQAFGSVFQNMFQNKSAGDSSRSNSPRSNSPQSNGSSVSAFSGMININGNAMQFSNPDDFNRAMEQFRRR